jgi:hypothetical protein
MTSNDTALAKRELGITEIIENIKKKPSLPYAERKAEITKSLFLERTNKDIKQLKFKTALYLTELERGDE